MVRRRLALIALGALVVVLGAWLWARTSSDPAPTTATTPTTPATGAVRMCPLTTLPAEAADTVRLIHSNGPFPFPRSDGEVFGNRERHLPEQKKGFYHEYTVVKPGARDRSVRRIVTGGAPLTNPAQYFYTGDHYDSFCQITGVEGVK